MGRPRRIAAGGIIYHALNRSNGAREIFATADDYQAFEDVLAEAHDRIGMRTLAYCVMPNHWHLVLWPREDGDLSRFMAWITLTHTQRWHAFHRTTGLGQLYQGRFKAFPVQADAYFLTVCRYVERNALRANLVDRAEDWRWSSLWHRANDRASQIDWLSEWPLDPPSDWLEWVNEPQTAAELEALRGCANRGRPFGDNEWVQLTARALALESSLRPRGRPRSRLAQSTPAKPIHEP